MKLLIISVKESSSKEQNSVRYLGLATVLVASFFITTIATKQVIINDGGHLNSESGYTEFKEFLEYL